MSEPLFLHCRMCVSDPARARLHQSPQEYARLSVWKEGDQLVVHCIRHDQLVGKFTLARPDALPATCQGHGH